MRDFAERVQQDTDVAAATDLHQPTYTEDKVAVIERVYRNGRVEEVEVVDETDRDIVRVLNSGKVVQLVMVEAIPLEMQVEMRQLFLPQLFVSLLLLHFLVKIFNSLTLQRKMGRGMATRSRGLRRGWSGIFRLSVGSVSSSLTVRGVVGLEQRGYFGSARRLTLNR